MNVYEVRVDGVTKKVTADHYDHDYNCGCVGLRFYLIINDPSSEDKAKLVAEFTRYDYVTLESDKLVLLNYPPIVKDKTWVPGLYDPDEPTVFTK